MYKHINQSMIEKIECGNNMVYIFDKSIRISPTEYKVLHNQGNDYLMKCMKIKMNDKNALFYLVKDYRCLYDLIHNLDSDNFMIVMVNLIKNICEVKNNGFLSCCSIDIALNKIFVHPNTLEVALVYVPVEEKEFEDDTEFENELRSRLIRIINNIEKFNTKKINEFKANLVDGNLSLEDVYKKLKGFDINRYIGPDISQNITPNKRVRLRLLSMNSQQRVEIIIENDECKIGRNPDMVDHVIAFNTAIGRQHCQIKKIGNDFHVYDLNSANGTFVNNQRIIGTQEKILNNGDVLKLADLNLKVLIE